MLQTMAAAVFGLTRRFSEHLAESEIYPKGARKRMHSLFQWSDPVKNKSRGAAPHDHVAAFELDASYGIGAALAAPKEYGGWAQRHGYNRCPGIFLITVLMQTESRSSGVAVDQASIGIVLGESGFGSGAHGEIHERIGHGGPGLRCLDRWSRSGSPWDQKSNQLDHNSSSRRTSFGHRAQPYGGKATLAQCATRLRAVRTHLMSSSRVEWALVYRGHRRQ